jgi:predicted RNase H-like nuclease
VRSVLGIDAAWTEREPSGVALISDDGSGWKLVDVTSSYDAFTRIDQFQKIAKHRGSIPDASAIIQVATSKIGSKINVVAIDMPLAMSPIVGRRASDNEISRIYGARHASTHTPSVTRPGRISDDLRIGFEQIGYPLAVSEFEGQALLEVYPHPALIELAAADRRLPYKLSKIGKYWRDVVPGARRENLIKVWAEIIALLDARVQGVAKAMPLPIVAARGFELKAFEDALDAVVCAWVGACVMDRKAKAYGDDESAIWIPDLSSHPGSLT